MAYSVEGHLKLKIAEYDRRIRTLVYAYEEMRVEHLQLLGRCLPPDGGLVLDLGGGTGALAAAIAERFPKIRVQIWDTDPAMLAFARERCAPFGDRVELIEKSFTTSLPACDAVVACIALHHVKDMGVKGQIYRNIFTALSPGGIFANADGFPFGTKSALFRRMVSISTIARFHRCRSSPAFCHVGRRRLLHALIPGNETPPRSRLRRTRLLLAQRTPRGVWGD